MKTVKILAIVVTNLVMLSQEVSAKPFQDIPQKDQKAYQKHLNLFGKYSKSGKIDKAIYEAKEMNKIWFYNVEVHVFLEHMYRKNGNPKEWLQEAVYSCELGKDDMCEVINKSAPEAEAKVLFRFGVCEPGLEDHCKSYEENIKKSYGKK